MRETWFNNSLQPDGAGVSACAGGVTDLARVSFCIASRLQADALVRRVAELYWVVKRLPMEEP